MLPVSMFQPLDESRQEIRLVRVSSASTLDAEINCSIFTVSLVDNPLVGYKAISYAADGVESTAGVRVEQVGGSIWVDQSLVMAIRYIRHESEDTLIWADSLCVNEHDIHERASQARLVGKIYNNAQVVVGWLGEEADDSRLALEFMESWQMLMNGPGRAALFLSLGLGGEGTMKRIQKAVPMAFAPEAKAALTMLAKRPFWELAWTYTHLAMANNAIIQTGKRVVPLEHCTATFFGLKLLSTIPKIDEVTDPYYTSTIACWCALLDVHPMGHMLKLVTGWPNIHKNGLDVLPFKLLEGMGRLKSIDPRNKIFALSGIIWPSNPFSNLLSADYEKPLDQIYIDAARYMILTDESLEILTRHPPSSLSASALPTWVPDWRLGLVPQQTVRYGVVEGQKPGLPSYLVPKVVDFSSDGRLLEVRGFERDVVAEILNTDGLFPFYDGPSLSTAFENLITHLLHGAPTAAEPALAAYFRLAVYNTKDDLEFPDVNGQTFLRDVARFLRYIAIKLQASNLLPPPSLSPTSSSPGPRDWAPILVNAFLGSSAPPADRHTLLHLLATLPFPQRKIEYLLTRLHHGVVPFRTRAGSMCMGPPGLALGDLVCHLVLHRKPFLLRPVPGFGTAERYINVGECDVLGLNLPAVDEDMMPRLKVFRIQ